MTTSTDHFPLPAAPAVAQDPSSKAYAARLAATPTHTQPAVLVTHPAPEIAAAPEAVSEPTATPSEPALAVAAARKKVTTTSVNPIVRDLQRARDLLMRADERVKELTSGGDLSILARELNKKSEAVEDALDQVSAAHTAVSAFATDLASLH